MTAVLLDDRVVRWTVRQPDHSILTLPLALRVLGVSWSVLRRRSARAGNADVRDWLTARDLNDGGAVQALAGGPVAWPIWRSPTPAGAALPMCAVELDGIPRLLLRHGLTSRGGAALSRADLREVLLGRVTSASISSRHPSLTTADDPKHTAFLQALDRAKELLDRVSDIKARQKQATALGSSFLDIFMALSPASQEFEKTPSKNAVVRIRRHLVAFLGASMAEAAMDQRLFTAGWVSVAVGLDYAPTGRRADAALLERMRKDHQRRATRGRVPLETHD